ncbi:FAD-binding oxidoreductase [Actinoplanes sp. TBRC 11911]|uniref:styrene monooxygenase/indole monooxygenase family protein n=1 Tax=Actinoplanes sp. TBRC 11911 TaxID=2729386 RepID=UPI00145ED0B2|nr:styrene monooxygenase/indole monooxygenase family protein [Actinoplanes sp. TBRC 11911]NMO57498.1 FAD-binding oxidoreductase [Actinoplanes sp. TBRC 11911]
MRTILIIGAGQSGLQLALGLQARRYDVTVMTDRGPYDVRAGNVLSTQVMFANAVATERSLGLDLWTDQAPRIDGLGISVAGPDAARVINWVGNLDGPAQSVDQRLKMAHWLETFAARGGQVIVRTADAAEIDRMSARYDLVLVATGRGGTASLFERDSARSPYDSPQRALAVAYVHGLAPRPEYDFQAVRANLIPGAGELFVMPCLTASGPCDILFWEGVPGGPLDVFGDVRDPAEHLERTLELMRAFTPWEHERAANGVELTDKRAVLSGRMIPVVRHPVAELPSGRLVLGVADVVVANDPITGQGSNSAAKCAAVYLAAILEHGDKPFDRAFMEAAFDRYWQVAEPVTTWTNAMLAPPPEHVLQLIGAAGSAQPVADRFANAFDDPADLDEWFFDPDAAQAYLTSVTQG